MTKIFSANKCIQKINYSLLTDDDADQPPEGEEEKEPVSYYINNEVHYTSPKMASLVCIKRGAVIEADKSIKSQVRLMNFSEGSPYETLHSYISKTVAPYFKSYVKESGRADRLVLKNIFFIFILCFSLGGRIFFKNI